MQYLGTVPTNIKLYSSYQNRECLHCHEGARSFLEAVTHKPELANIRSNKTSCLTKGCHDVVHGVDHLDGLPMWPAEKGAAP